MLLTLEMAETVDDERERAAYLTFVFVGAGYAGLEGLAELQDFAADVIELYPRCRVQGMRWMLVEARDRMMQEIQPGLAEFAARELRGRGIEIRTDTTIEEVDRAQRAPVHRREVPTRTVAWTAGVKPHPVVANLGLPLDGGGRIKVDRFMQVEGHDDVWAIGDAAAVPDPAHRARPSPPTAQHGLRQGRVVARNVAAALGDGPRAAVSLPHARRVRRHGPPPGRRQHAGHQMARVPRVVPRADLPPARDAGHQASPAPGRRLDRRPAVRAVTPPSWASSGTRRRSTRSTSSRRRARAARVG